MNTRGGLILPFVFVFLKDSDYMSNKTTKKTSFFWAKIIGTGCGAGYCPFAPGTAGSLWAGILWYLLYLLFPSDTFYSVLAALIILSTLAGVWAASRLQTIWGEDPSRVVIDEMVGTWIVLFAVPAGSLFYALWGILLFRFFDIFKPLGIRRMEEIPQGWGVMLDDILAGIYGLLCMILLQWIIYCL